MTVPTTFWRLAGVSYVKVSPSAVLIYCSLLFFGFFSFKWGGGGVYIWYEKRPSAEGISEKWCLGTLFLPRYCHEETENKWLSVVKLWWGGGCPFGGLIITNRREGIYLFIASLNVSFSRRGWKGTICHSETLTLDKVSYGQSYMSWEGGYYRRAIGLIREQFSSWPQHHHFSFLHLFSHPHPINPPHTHNST